MPTDVFDPTNVPATEGSANPLADLVGDGKKFKTVEDLAKGKAESDAYIEQLKRETAALREELKKATLTDEQLEGLRNEIKTLREAKPQGSRDDTNPALTVDSIKSLVAETITKTELNRTAQQNVLEANSAVVKQFGTLENAAAAVKAKAAEIGMSMEALRDIAAKSPTAFLKIVGVDPVLNVEPLSPSRVEPVGDPKQPHVRLAAGSKEFFDNILKTQGRSVYFSPSVQTALFKAVKAGTYQL